MRVVVPVRRLFNGERFALPEIRRVFQRRILTLSAHHDRFARSRAAICRASHLMYVIILRGDIIPVRHRLVLHILLFKRICTLVIHSSRIHIKLLREPGIINLLCHVTMVREIHNVVFGINFH